MKKNYLISWNDDNHFPSYWFNTTYLGCDLNQIINSALNLPKAEGNIIPIGLDIDRDDFPEDIWEQLFDYFQTQPNFDEVDIKLIAKNDWHNFYAKNIKKIMRKVLTNKKS